MKYLRPTTCLFAALSTTAWAEVHVRFYEGAPKDRFEVEYKGKCPVSDVELEIDLGTSAAGLILDTTATGAGVSVYQPLEFVAGQDLLKTMPLAMDGDTTITMSVAILRPGDRIVFTTDVDDTKGTGPTMISGAEITGAMVVLKGGGQTMSAPFDHHAEATVAIDTCST